MKNAHYLLIALLFLSFTALGQWEKDYTQGFYKLDYGIDLVQSTDNGFVILSETWSANDGKGTDVWILKVDQEGNEIWSTVHGGSNFDKPTQIISDGEDGYFVTGYSKSAESKSYSGFLLRIDGEGNKLWSTNFPSDEHEYLNDLVLTNDGGVLLIGEAMLENGSSSQLLIIKTTFEGDVVRRLEVGSNKFEKGNSIRVTPNGDYEIAGYSTNTISGVPKGWMVTLSSNFETLSEISLTKEHWEEIKKLKTIDNTRRVIVGTADARGKGDQDGWMAMVGENDSIIWENYYGSFAKDELFDFVQTSEGKFIAVGYTSDIGKKRKQVWLVGIDENGNEEWVQTYGTKFMDQGLSILEVSENSFFVVGSKGYTNGQSKLWLMNIDSSGNIKAQKL